MAGRQSTKKTFESSTSSRLFFATQERADVCCSARRTARARPFFVSGRRGASASDMAAAMVATPATLTSATLSFTTLLSTTLSLRVVVDGALSLDGPVEPVEGRGGEAAGVAAQGREERAIGMGRAASRRLGDAVTSSLLLGAAGDGDRAPRDDTRRSDVAPSNPRTTTTASRVEGVVGPVGTIASRKARSDASLGRGVGADIGRGGMMYLFCDCGGGWREVGGSHGRVKKWKCTLWAHFAGSFFVSLLRDICSLSREF